ncbi:glycosyltransferase family 92 protein [Gimesia panareensis]|uniref:glycosyltransferase family 92 protein n=1 Tax=Gimesia panareensis TaxID=2527978 RepID=UPI0018D64B62|nr:glycosyltransferase family 92 protein [Gimesia panareensis]
MTRIGLVTMFLPRMEMGHLQEWVEYHRMIGVTRFYLYNNGHFSVDPVFGNGKTDKIWHKKPEANYHLELSDEIVDQRINQIIDSLGPGIEHLAWQEDSFKELGFRHAQLKAANCQTEKLKVSNHVDWLGFIDIDELLVPNGRDLRKALMQIPDDVSALKISQKLFKARWHNQLCVPYSEIDASFGLLDFNHKLIGRVPRIKKWINPHRLVVSHGDILQVHPEELRFHHFRGNQHKGIPAPKNWGIHKYLQIRNEILEKDKSHIFK